jgi:hypothetical protein
MFKVSQRNMAEHCLAKKITQYKILNLWKGKIPTHDKGHHYTEAEVNPVMNITFTTRDTTKWKEMTIWRRQPKRKIITFVSQYIMKYKPLKYGHSF